MPESVLVIAPHPDDESIGCGGALRQHADRGDRVHAVFLTSGELGLKHLPAAEAWRIREGEARLAADVLGIAKMSFLRWRDWFVGQVNDKPLADLQAILTQDCPDTIYLPHPRESHPDHQAAAKLTLQMISECMAVRPAAWMYEIWTPLSAYDRIIDVTSVMAAKLRAVRCYRSQLSDYRYDQAIRGLNQYRGIISARCRYAEVFRSAWA